MDNLDIRCEVLSFLKKERKKGKREQHVQIALVGIKLRDCCHLVRLFLAVVLAPGAASRARIHLGDGLHSFTSCLFFFFFFYSRLSGMFYLVGLAVKAATQTSGRRQNRRLPLTRKVSVTALRPSQGIQTNSSLVT